MPTSQVLLRAFILGAPKCGTTSMAAWLAQHPELELSRVKEPHFYSSDLRNREVASKSAYEELFFPKASKTRVLLDASTWYLFSQEAVSNILKDHPSAKFIVMLRDPVEMAISLYFHNRAKGHEDQATFEQAWSLQEERALGRRIPRGCREPAFLQYRRACSIGTLTERLLRVVDRSAVLLFHLDDIKDDTEGQFARATRFLGLGPYENICFDKKNEAREARVQLMVPLLRSLGRLKKWMGINRNFGLAALNFRKLEKKQMGQEFRCLLEDELDNERKIVEGLK